MKSRVGRYPTFLLPTAEAYTDPNIPDQIKPDDFGFVIESSFPVNLPYGLDVVFPSHLHRRSAVFWTLQAGDSAPVDEYGNKYYSASMKGAVIDPKISISNSESDNFRVLGLQKAGDALDARAGSDLLRSLGIETEWVVALRQPLELPDHRITNFRKDKLVDPKELVRKIPGYAKYVRRYPDHQDAIDGFSPMVMFRMHKSAFRPWDLSEASKGLLFETVADHVFNDLLPTLAEHKLCPFDIESMHNRDKVEVLLDYFTSLFPQLLGANLGTLWYYGIAHQYLHGGNVSLAGEIVDNDTLKDSGKVISDHSDFATNSLNTRLLPETDTLIFREINTAISYFALRMGYRNYNIGNTVMNKTKQHVARTIGRLADEGATRV